jgi:hypothetical protein
MKTLKEAKFAPMEGPPLDKKSSNIRLDLDIWKKATETIADNKIIGKGPDSLATLISDATRIYLSILPMVKKAGLSQDDLGAIVQESVRRYLADRKLGVS